MSAENAYKMVKKLMAKSLGLGKPENADAEIARILVEMNPDTLVHATSRGNVLCGRVRESSWNPEVRWLETEVTVGIFGGDVINCSGCCARLSEVQAEVNALRQAFEDRRKRKA